MTNSKKKNGKQPKQQSQTKKTQPRSKKRRQTPKVRQSIPRSSLNAICAISDPFCHHAQGSQLYTSASTRTFPFQLHTSYSLLTNVEGRGAMLLLPGWNYLASFDSSGGGADATFSSIAPTNNSLPAGFYRIVSAGYIFRKSLTPLNASGMLRVRSFDSSDGATLGFVSYTSYNCAAFLDKSLATADEIAIASRVTNGPLQEALVPPTTTNPTPLVTAWRTPGLSPVMIAVTGAPAATIVGEVEIFVNYEVVFVDSDPMAQAAKVTPPLTPLMATVKAQMASSFDSIARNGIQQFSRNVERKAEQLLINALRPPATMLP